MELPGHDEDTLAAYDYDLPGRLIASRPPPQRGDSRLLVLERTTGRISHHQVRELPDLIEHNEIAVFNDSRVIPARLEPDEGEEVLLLEQEAAREWTCLVRPGKKFRAHSRNAAAGTGFEVLEVRSDGTRLIRFDAEPDLERYGTLPLPPYMGRPADQADATRYQTVFARRDGSVAAPTAGLHFTEEMLSRIDHTFITLHVGLGTFQPVKSPDLADHHMHDERYTLSPDAATAINRSAKILAVGTTVVRTLESQPDGPLQANSGRTRIFIRPPYRFRHVDHLLTNFHLPRSTLLMLVSAFAGRELIREAYAVAIAQEYRFFSYGDCMLIL